MSNSKNNVRCYRDPLAPDTLVTTKVERLSDEGYKEAVQKMVIACTDVILTTAGDRAIYLAKRNIFPMKGVWCFGGTIFFNDATPADAMARSFKTETGFSLPASRFTFVATHLYSWTKLAQGDFPGKNLAITFHAEVTPSELATIKQGLSASEYDRVFGVQRFDRARLIDEHVHQAMLDIFDDIFSPS